MLKQTLSSFPRFILGALSAVFILTGCASHIPESNQLGFSDTRRFVIVGENVDPAIAAYYQRKYECNVWFTPNTGKVTHAANNFIESGIGPSRALRTLIGQLKSTNYTVGRWEIIVPKIAEKYVLTAFKNMPASSMAKSRGMIVLIDSSGHPDMEKQVARVTDNNFFVVYEFQQDQ